MMATKIIPDFSEEDKQRFLSKIEKTEDCWIWKNCVDEFGYGAIWYRGSGYRAHRIMWALTYGQPGNLLVLHKCDNPKCVNPDHLFLGNHQDNGIDMIKKGRGNFQKRPDTRPRGDRHKSRTMPERTLKGEQHGCAKLTNEDVIFIRKAGRKADRNALAAQFHVNRFTIDKILYGTLWKHLPINP